MNNIDFESFLKWQQEKEERAVEIHLGGIGTPKLVSVWVYDYKIMEGQFVKSVDEIDLLGERERRLKGMIAELEDIKRREN